MKAGIEKSTCSQALVRGHQELQQGAAHVSWVWGVGGGGGGGRMGPREWQRLSLASVHLL